jgi:predicted GIY-YIG superfamily endonuclease
MSRWWVYIVPKVDRFYVGITTNPPNRLRQHGSPAFYYLKGPFCETEAGKLEKRLKNLPQRKKRDLIFESSQQ